MNQLDTIHGIANPFKITKYDKQKCIIELEEQPSFPIMSDKLHGGFCLTKEDAADYKAWAQAKCKNDQHIEKLEEENRELKKQIAILVLRKCFEDK